jgi:O-antigen/teichoic acid export membrane protein
VGLAAKSLGTFVSKIAIFLIRFPIGILAARYLGPEGKGLLHLLVTSVLICSVLNNLGIGTASVYFVGKDRTRLSAIVSNLLALTVLMGIFTGIVGWAVLQYGRPDIYAQFPAWLWGVVAVLVPIHLLHSFSTNVLSSLLRIKEINILRVANTILQLLFFVAFVVLLERGMVGAFLAYGLADLLVAGGFLWIVLRHSGGPSRPDLSLFVASLRFGLKDYLTNLTRHLIIRLDVFIVASLAMNGVRAAGIYSVATNLAELVLFIPMSLRLSLFPMVAASSEAEANRLTPAACRHTMALTIVSALALGLTGPFAITYLYGEAFSGAILPLLILLPGIVMVSQAHIFYGDLNGRGKPGATAISALLSLVVTIFLNFAMIPRYGIIGAAIASTCAYAVEFVAGGIFFTRYSGMRWKQSLIFRRSDLDYYLNMLPKFSR